jgi:predicted GNAT family N-acyltransferase
MAQLATTPEALEAIYRLRYQIYISELGKGFLPEVNHAHGWIRDAEDTQAGAYAFYTGSLKSMSGTVRLQVWEPGCVPDAVSRRFSLHLFPGIDGLRVSEVARLVVKPEHRGSGVVSELACAAFELGAERHDVFICFLYCSPGLVHAFMRFGFRPYPGFVIPNEDGIRLPMFMAASDLAHLQAVGSPLAPVMARHFAGQRLPADVATLVQAVEDLHGHYETKPERVWEEVREQLRPGRQTASALLDGLTEEEVCALCRHGFVMEIPAGKVVMRQGLVERELYLALTGHYEVRMEHLKLAELSTGDVLGEISFFQRPGRRVATVRSLTPGRVMVLDRHFVQRLSRTHPQITCRILYNLGRIVSGHLHMALQAHVDRG